jgi:small subunit ribosomal protein S20
MANIKSAKKRAKKSAKLRLTNRQKRSELRTYIKKVRSLVEEKKVDDAKVILKKACSVIDKASNKNLIHTNKARRLKSRLMKLTLKPE